MAISADQGPHSVLPVDSDEETADDTTQSMVGIRRERRSRRRPRLDRRLIGGVLVAVVTGWLTLSLVGAVTHARQLRAAANDLRQETEQLRAQVEAGAAEIEVIQGDVFLSLEARGYSMGAPGERAFALAPGAPAPKPITALGADSAPLPPADVFEELLDLLLGV
jgi:hypothetical protein